MVVITTFQLPHCFLSYTNISFEKVNSFPWTWELLFCLVSFCLFLFCFGAKQFWTRGDWFFGLKSMLRYVGWCGVRRNSCHWSGAVFVRPCDSVLPCAAWTAAPLTPPGRSPGPQGTAPARSIPTWTNVPPSCLLSSWATCPIASPGSFCPASGLFSTPLSWFFQQVPPRQTPSLPAAPSNRDATHWHV